jgi:hypothetical protein
LKNVDGLGLQGPTRHPKDERRIAPRAAPKGRSSIFIGVPWDADRLRFAELTWQSIPEDVERLSPLLLDHVSVLGWCEFVLTKFVREGRLRPLRDPKETEDLAA